MERYCTKIGDDWCINNAQEMIQMCEDLHDYNSVDWFNCRLNVVDYMINGRICNNQQCQRDDEYNYDCIADGYHEKWWVQIKDFCPNTLENNDTVVCDSQLVDESERTYYFACDMNCLELYPDELYDCKSGCDLPNDICSFNTLLELSDTNNDGRASMEECSVSFDYFFQTPH